MIPKSIHFVWIGSDLPAWAERNIEEFRRLNPGYEVRLRDAGALLPELHAAYASAIDDSSRADLIRYSVLACEGGWYFDCDFWPLRPLDDAVRAWQLDGDKLFLSRQKGNRSANLPYANGVLACGPGCPAIRDVIDVACETPATSRCAFGPILIKRLIEADPHRVVIAQAGWWFPLEQQKAATAYEYLRAGYTGTLHLDPETSGQLPFGVHLWAHVNNETLAQSGAGLAAPRPVAVVATASRADHPLHAIAAGLERAGYNVVRASDAREISQNFVAPSVVACWNGLRDTSFPDEARRCGAITLFMEHGFYQRQDYSQVDHAGFLHWASWLDSLSESSDGSAAPEPPAGAAARLARFHPAGVRPIRARRDGYILVLGQVPNDSQMYESELKGPVPLQRHLKRHISTNTPCFFRPHPSCSNVRHNPRHDALPLLTKVEGTTAVEYQQTKHGKGLGEALAGARFVITINSNAITEALVAGVPCLAFGPHLGIKAGVVHRCTLATLHEDIGDMQAGWAPEPGDVVRYLEWLAARQWSNDELAQGDVLADLLDAAGVTPPQIECLAEATEGVTA